MKRFLFVCAATAAMTGCGPRGSAPIDLLTLEAGGPYTRIGDTLRVSRAAETDLWSPVAVAIASKRTGASKTLELPAGVAVATFPLDAATLPDLTADLAKIERYWVKATLRQGTVTAEVAIVQDPEARMPPMSALSQLAGMGPMPGSSPIPEPAPPPGLLDSRAEAALRDWQPATYSMSFERLAGKDLPYPILGMEASWFRCYTATGSFSKFVIPARLSGAPDDQIATPAAIKIYIPEVGEGPVAYEMVKL